MILGRSPELGIWAFMERCSPTIGEAFFAIGYSRTKVRLQKTVIQYRLSEARKPYQQRQDTASLLIEERTAMFRWHLSGREGQ